jgi:hypothetical protein
MSEGDLKIFDRYKVGQKLALDKNKPMLLLKSCTVKDSYKKSQELK